MQLCCNRNGTQQTNIFFISNLAIKINLNKLILLKYYSKQYSSNVKKWKQKSSSWCHFLFNPLKPVLPPYRNQSLICYANQLVGFFMRATLALNGLIGFKSWSWRVKVGSGEIRRQSSRLRIKTFDNEPFQKQLFIIRNYFYCSSVCNVHSYQPPVNWVLALSIARALNIRLTITF